MADVRFLLSGDSSVTVEFGNEISPAINAQIRAFTIALEESKLPGIVEVVPTPLPHGPLRPRRHPL